MRTTLPDLTVGAIPCHRFAACRSKTHPMHGDPSPQSQLVWRYPAVRDGADSIHGADRQWCIAPMGLAMFPPCSGGLRHRLHAFVPTGLPPPRWADNAFVPTGLNQRVCQLKCLDILGKPDAWKGKIKKAYTFHRPDGAFNVSAMFRWLAPPATCFRPYGTFPARAIVPWQPMSSVSNSLPSSKSKNPITHSTKLVEHRAVGVEETGQPGAAVGGLG